jgi:hypothetical protein
MELAEELHLLSLKKKKKKKKLNKHNIEYSELIFKEVIQSSVNTIRKERGLPELDSKQIKKLFKILIEKETGYDE